MCRLLISTVHMFRTKFTMSHTYHYVLQCLSYALLSISILPRDIPPITTTPSTKQHHDITQFSDNPPWTSRLSHELLVPTKPNDEANGMLPSEFASPTISLSKNIPPSTPGKYRRKRLGFNKPAPASEGIKGTEKEKKRVQTIADSLDFGSDLPVAEGVRDRRSQEPPLRARIDNSQLNRVVRKEDLRWERPSDAVTTGMPVEKRKSVG